MHGIPKNRPKMEICQKIDVFPKIHTVKTLFLLTSALAIKCHIVRNIMLKTRMIYPDRIRELLTLDAKWDET